MPNLKIINKKFATTKYNRYKADLDTDFIILIYNKKTRYRYIINYLNWVLSLYIT